MSMTLPPSSVKSLTTSRSASCSSGDRAARLKVFAVPSPTGGMASPVEGIVLVIPASWAPSVPGRRPRASPVPAPIPRRTMSLRERCIVVVSLRVDPERPGTLEWLPAGPPKKEEC